MFLGTVTNFNVTLHWPPMPVAAASSGAFPVAEFNYFSTCCLQTHIQSHPYMSLSSNDNNQKYSMTLIKTYIPETYHRKSNILFFKPNGSLRLR